MSNHQTIQVFEDERRRLMKARRKIDTRIKAIDDEILFLKTGFRKGMKVQYEGLTGIVESVEVNYVGFRPTRTDGQPYQTLVRITRPYLAVILEKEPNERKP